MKKVTFKSVLAIAVIIAGIASVSMFTSCKKSDNTPAATVTLSLYDSLGGTTMVKDPTSTSGTMIETGRLGIRSVVDSTILVIAGDPNLNNKFFSVLLTEVGNKNYTGFMELSKNLTDFFCYATGSKTIKYTGMDMVSAHDPAKNNRMGTKASSTDFDLFVGDLVKGAKKNGLSDDIINNHIGPLIYTVKSAVVQK